MSRHSINVHKLTSEVGGGAKEDLGLLEELLSDGLVKVVEAAQFLRISRSHLYNLMESGELPFVRLGRTRRIPRNAVVRLAAQHICGVKV